VELTAGTAQFHLRTLPPEDFPRLPEFEGEPITLPGDPLADTVERVVRAASRDEVRPILTGVLVTAEERTLTMVATDSYRLSVKHTELASPVSQPLEANVPARALRELSRIVSSESVKEVEIALLPNQVVFRADGALLSSRLIEGQFPSHRQLIPESFEHEVRLPRGELLEVARRIGQLAQRNAPLRLAFSDGELTIAAETPEVGDASEAMPAPAITTLAKGAFTDADGFHKGSGTALVARVGADRVLRLEEFRVTNGPDLYVYLAAHPQPRSRAEVDQGFVSLGRLKGNMGAQNYSIPSSVRLDAHQSVVIYCRRFHVVFSTATLRPSP